MLAAALEQQKARALPFQCLGVCGDLDREGAGNDDLGGRLEPSACPRLLLHDRDLPGPGAAACVRERDVAARRATPGPDVQQAEREALWRGEDERIDGVDEVDEASALAGRRRLGARRPGEPDGFGRLDERRLHLLDRPVRVALAKQGRGARHVRRSHARAGEVLERAAGLGREDVDPRRRDVRLEGERQRRRAAAGERGDALGALRANGGGDRDRGRGGARRGDRAPAQELVVVACRDDRYDAGRGGVVDRPGDRVARRLDLGLAEREVDHVHAVGDGRLDRGDELRRVPVEADRVRRDRESLVVPEIRERCDARDRDLGESSSAGTTVPCRPAAMPATWVPWNELTGSNGRDA